MNTATHELPAGVRPPSRTISVFAQQRKHTSARSGNPSPPKPQLRKRILPPASDADITRLRRVCAVKNSNLSGSPHPGLAITAERLVKLATGQSVKEEDNRDWGSSACRKWLAAGKSKCLSPETVACGVRSGKTQASTHIAGADRRFPVTLHRERSDEDRVRTSSSFQPEP